MKEIFFSLIIIFIGFFIANKLSDFKRLAFLFSKYKNAINNLLNCFVSKNSKKTSEIKLALDSVTDQGINLILYTIKFSIPYIFCLFFLKLIDTSQNNFLVIIISSLPYLKVKNNKQ